MNSTVEQLKEVLNMPNPQNFRIKTDLGQRCKRCTGRCQNNHYSLDREYGELKVVISNMLKHKEPMECFKHSTVTYHPPHNCNKAKCERCGSWGHSKEVCNDKLYYWNRFFLCKCDGRRCKRRRSETQFKGGNHCCTCQKPVIFYEAYSNYKIGKLRCNECHENSVNNKRPPTPDTDEGNKKPKFNIPEPEDPMQDMELNPPRIQNKGKEKQKYTEIKCTNCNRKESPINCINNLDKLGYDPEDEDDMSEEQDKINKMSGKIQKYLKKEFKERIFSEYPKERIEEALDVIVPPEITNMISEHIENKELTQVIPIRTINDTIEWTEEIRQPWELNGEFIWPEEELLENPIPIMYIIQEVNPTDNRIIELQNHIVKLENEIAIKDQMNEGLRNQLEETQYQLNETARMCNENANMVMNAQEWMKYFKNKYDRRNKWVNELKKKGNILLTKYVNKNNDLKERIEELEQEINFGNVLFNQIIDLNMTISSDIDIDPSMENMELLRY
ncbi:hypothetical protein GLOIN_2v1489129 [Rhizophagus irregularis DAOM 181602=DAOM 197198]|uniref:Uncharacterized protein n=1 Tax=Rhizophagus irregularis (strain DAOM 181602 / DAOM 197198 / MUCL 43194) TaxID=747089 RepID=A0A2P4NX65_RHIID|nr:hypothetical protein GLOIN_2v1489129 [Rhizophagus irregularis DAOM 181602=DAOM 197198]POG57729.1 hypothetical protein GLOIN_2v1489129 [Rhizophagus irregularis DAOM 181602=DAOM 197198]|eukprot:XP_025164595.1 hypothetical protein GLOIN_2v1489129 [Rhizophagus irregularis DAOM 181602=DAOM 197198]